MEDKDWSIREEKFRKLASIPFYTAAYFLPLSEDTFVVHSYFKDWDLDKMEDRKCVKSIFGIFGSVMKTASVVHDSSFVQKTAFNPNTFQQAILRTYEISGKLDQFIEIWNNDTHLRSYNLSKKDLHGKVYDDSEFGCLSWNENNMILYVAEKKPPELSCLAKEQLREQEDYSFSDDWGESHKNYKTSVICTMDANDGSISVLPIFDGSHLTFGQAVWVKNDSIAFIVWEKGPLTLGILHCRNRKSTLYYHELNSNITRQLSEYGNCVHSPCCSPDSKYIVYFQNSVGGAHKKGSSLIKYNFEDSTREVIIDIVNEASENNFPGLYVDNLPHNCWTENSEFVIFSSTWRSNKVALAVSVRKHSFKVLKNPSWRGSYEVLDVYKDVIIARVSSFDTEPFLAWGSIKYDENDISVEWSALDPDAPKSIDGIDWSIHSLDPDIKHEVFPFLDYEVIRVYPKDEKNCLPALIVWPHGGPHSAFTTEFSLFAVAFVLQGFSVCLVNYRGSIGFGENNLNSLIGKIGSQDISDVHFASIFAKDFLSMYKDSEVNVFLFGGSHGGLIIPHLCAKYPDYYKACVCRNPVTNLAGLIGVSDIPDWVWSETGHKLNGNYLYDNYLPEEMWKMSPVSIARKVKVPTMILLGKNDRRVPPAQGLSYYRILKAAGKTPVRVFMYDSNHSLDSTVAVYESFHQSSKFFLEYGDFNFRMNTPDQID